MRLSSPNWVTFRESSFNHRSRGAWAAEKPSGGKAEAVPQTYYIWCGERVLTTHILCYLPVSCRYVSRFPTMAASDLSPRSKSECRAVVVAKVKLRELAMRVRLAPMLINAFHVLKDGEVAF
jgi:hypothetical protein